MKKCAVFLFLMLLSAPIFAHIEQLFYLKGMMGNQAIVMRIHREAELYYGEYFFANEKKNIRFRGECPSGDCTLNVLKFNPSTQKEEITESFHIHENKDKTWTGYMLTGTDKKEVKLEPIDINTIAHPYKDIPFIKNCDPYTYVRTANLKFIPVKTQKVNGISLEWVKESLSGITFIRIKKGLDTAAIRAVNKTLASLHFNQVENQFWCSSSSYNGQYQFNFSISFLSKHIMGLVSEVSSNCQGTGIEKSSDNLAIDLKTGNNLILEDIFYAGKLPVPTMNSGEWFTYRYNTFADTFYKILAQRYPDQFKASSGKCDFNKSEAWQFPSWRLSDKGLVLKPFFAEYLHCDNQQEFVIPYAELEAFRKRPVNNKEK